MTRSNTEVINYQNWHEFEFSEEFTFSADGKDVYFKRTFKNGQILYWVYDSSGFTLDEGMPSSARAYAAVNRSKR